MNEWRGILLDLDEAVVRYKPAADRWSIAEVIGHLVDSACNNHQRFIRAQESDALRFPKYEQNLWVAAGNYQQSDWLQLVELWSLYNLHIAHVMCNIPERKLETPCMAGIHSGGAIEVIVVDIARQLQFVGA